MSNETEISREQLVIIIGEDWIKFQNLLNYCLCTTCKKSVAIVDYKIFLNSMNDIILKGECVECNTPVNRYIETGENLKYIERIKNIRQCQARTLRTLNN